jgi:hypothetical protein
MNLAYYWFVCGIFVGMYFSAVAVTFLGKSFGR